MAGFDSAIPLLTSTLGYIYDVPGGKYADPDSCKRQVIAWENYLTEGKFHVQQYGGKEYHVPNVVDFRAHTTSDYTITTAKTAQKYSAELSLHASLDAKFPGFSGSASADFTSDQRSNVSNQFTRIAYRATHYTISLPDAAGIRPLVEPEFLDKVDAAARDAVEKNFVKAFALFDDYGTHMLRSVVIGGRGAFLSVTDSRDYSSSISIGAAAKISASYSVVSGGASLSAKDKHAMDSFNSSSSTFVQTDGGDPKYGNENFVKNVESWAASITQYPAFLDFGPSPSLIGIWEFASSSELNQALMEAYAPYTEKHVTPLALPGPYLDVRTTLAVNADLNAYFWDVGGWYTLKFPKDLDEGWYLISPHYNVPLIAREVGPIKGVLAPVTWKVVFDISNDKEDTYSRFWRAVPPTDDFVGLGCVGFTGTKSVVLGTAEPPENVAGRYRAVHKSALTAANSVINFDNGKGLYLQEVDRRCMIAVNEVREASDLLAFDSSMAIIH